MQIHRHLVDSIGQCLEDIFHNGKYADKAIERAFRQNRKWGSRDRRFFAESVYEVVRWWRKLWFVLDEEPASHRGEALRAYQDEALRAWGAHWVLAGRDLPPWPMFEGLKPSEIRHRALLLERDSDPSKLAVRESIPDWMNEWGWRECGARWPSIIASLNQKSTVDLRVNTLKTSLPELKARLQKEEIITEIVQGQSEALTLQERRNVFATQSYRDGLFEVQDRASQKIAPLLQVKAGQRVVDACAGAGGKTLHLATLMGNRGKILALDIHEWKLEELRLRARRNGIHIIETKVIDSTKVIKRLQDSADRVLLDVPCSGMGVLRRNPDTKWKLTPMDLEKFQRQQQDILQEYSAMTKVQGLMVYATCSVMPSENEKQVERFLEANHGRWQLVNTLRNDPDAGQGDGFFASCLRRLS